MLLNLGKLRFAIPYPSYSFLFIDLTIDCEGTVLQIGSKALNWPLHRIFETTSLFLFFSVFFFNSI